MNIYKYFDDAFIFNLILENTQGFSTSDLNAGWFL